MVCAVCLQPIADDIPYVTIYPNDLLRKTCAGWLGTPGCLAEAHTQCIGKPPHDHWRAWMPPDWYCPVCAVSPRRPLIEQMCLRAWLSGVPY